MSFGLVASSVASSPDQKDWKLIVPLRAQAGSAFETSSFMSKACYASRLIQLARPATQEDKRESEMVADELGPGVGVQPVYYVSAVFPVNCSRQRWPAISNLKP